MSKSGILLAEDDPFLVKIIKNRLTEEGFSVEVAVNGEEALEKIKAGNFALIMLDLVMPKKTGFEVLQEMRQEEIKAPVFVFSNLSQQTDKDEVIALGAQAYFVKSDIAIDELANQVRQFCSKG